MAKTLDVFGHPVDLDDNGNLSIRRQPIQRKAGDYGCDPLPDGTFRMVPSGDVVDLAERRRRLAHLYPLSL